MTPKEKAKELLFKKFGCSKRYALLAVDEIYKLTLNIGQHLEEFEDKANYYSYWEEVKQHIEQL